MNSPEIFPGTIIGFRCWIVQDDGFLYSLGYNYSWETSVEKAKCLANNNHTPPAQGCECGLYAFYDLKNVFETMFYRNLVHHKTDNFLIGLVAGKGKTALHEKGFRSEEMSIVALTTVDNLPPSEYIGFFKDSLYKPIPAELKKKIVSNYRAPLLSIKSFQELIQTPQIKNSLASSLPSDFIPKSHEIKAKPRTPREPSSIPFYNLKKTASVLGISLFYLAFTTLLSVILIDAVNNFWWLKTASFIFVLFSTVAIIYSAFRAKKIYKDFLL